MGDEEPEQPIPVSKARTRLAAGDIVVEFESDTLTATDNAQIALNLFDELKRRSEADEGEEEEPGEDETEGEEQGQGQGVNLDIDGQKEFEKLMAKLAPKKMYTLRT